MEIFGGYFQAKLNLAQNFLCNNVDMWVAACYALPARYGLLCAVPSLPCAGLQRSDLGVPL